MAAFNAFAKPPVRERPPPTTGTAKAGPAEGTTENRPIQDHRMKNEATEGAGSRGGTPVGSVGVLGGTPTAVPEDRELRPKGWERDSNWHGGDRELQPSDRQLQREKDREIMPPPLRMAKGRVTPPTSVVGSSASSAAS